MMKLFTIGFTKKSSEVFFNLLKMNKVKTLVDIRFSNDNPYCFFTKKRDLPYFLKTIANIKYIEEKLFAPTKEDKNRIKEEKHSYWPTFKKNYNKLLKDRDVISKIDISDYDSAVLLCSEVTAEICHRRLVAEYLQSHFPDIEIIHL